MNQFERQKHNKMGESGFYHFFGVVEGRDDPLKSGRLQVRIYGDHTDDLTALPTNELPWAQIVVPLTGHTNTMPSVRDGQLVFGYYADGIEKQVPIILGQVPTIKDACLDEEGIKEKGFQDQRETQETKRPDGTQTPTGIDTAGSNPDNYKESAHFKKREETKHISSINSYTEPTSTYNAKYPYNKAIETESGHVIEYDDSPGAERIMIQHRSGAYVEMIADGTVLYKAVGNRHDIVNGSATTSVSGSTNTLVGGNYDVAIGGNLQITVNGNANLNVSGSMNVKTGGAFNLNAGGDVNLKGSNINLN